MERRTETGLVMGHAYGVTAIKKVHLGTYYNPSSPNSGQVAEKIKFLLCKVLSNI